MPFLETAAQNHQTLAIVSNFDERLGVFLRDYQESFLPTCVIIVRVMFLEGILADLDLLKYFDILVVSRKVGHMKPSPLIFQLLIEKTGMEPKEIVHVGNSLVCCIRIYLNDYI